MIDDVGDLFRELKLRFLKIQVGGHVDGDSETTTNTIKKTN
jgi:hypothetical protein